MKNYLITHRFYIYNPNKIKEENKISFIKIIKFLIIFSSIASLSLNSIPPVSSQPENIEVLSYNWYIDSLDYFIVVGELQNKGSNTINSVFLSGIVYTKDGESQADSYAQAFVNQLLPQQKAPFYIEYTPSSSYTGDLNWFNIGVDSVDFSVNLAESTTEYQYPDLSIESSSGGVDVEGVYWVNGEIKNSGTQTAKNIRVVGTFYNSSDCVVAVGYTDVLIPTSLSPSDIVSFKVGAFDLNQTLVSPILKISSYSLLIQTEEPILTGDPPDLPEINPSPTSSENSNVLSNEIIFATVGILAIIGSIGILLMLRKKDHK